MTFLFPIVLGGLALVAVPLLLHLIMRRKPKTLPFPAFRFLIQRRRNNLRKLRLRHFLLLALRLLIIAAIVLAVAQPKVFHDALQLSGQRPTNVVLLFDTSSSMDYRSIERRSRLEEAKRQANELLDKLGPGSRVIVLDSAETRELGDKSWQSRAEARKAIDQLKLRPANAPVTAWLKQVYPLFERAAKDADLEVRRMPRLLAVFSDRTAACWEQRDVAGLHDRREAVPPPLEELQQVYKAIPPLVELLEPLRQQLAPIGEQNFPDHTLVDQLRKLRDRVPAYGPQEYPDNGIREVVAGVRATARQLTELLQKREAKDEAKEYRDKVIAALRTLQRDLRGVREIFFDVGVEKAVDGAVVELRFPEKSRGDGERLVFGQQEVFWVRATVQATGDKLNTTVHCDVDDSTLPDRKAVDLKAGDGGEVAFQIDCKGLKPGTHQLRVSLTRPDQHTATDQRFATFTVRKPRRLLVIADKKEDAATGIWKNAVEARKDYLLECELRTPGEVVKAVERDSTDLDRFQAVFLYQVAQPRELWKPLAGYVGRGGGLGVVLGGDELKKAEYAGAEAKALLPAEPKEVVAAKEGVPLNWNDPAVYKHPLLQPVGEWKQTFTLDFLQEPRLAFRYWEVKAAADARTLLAYLDGKQRPMFLERQPYGTKSGRVLLLTTPMDATRKPPWNNYMETAGSSFCVVLPGLWANYLAGDPEDVRLNFLARSRLAPVVPLPLDGRTDVYQLFGDLLTVQPTGDKNARDPLRRNELVEARIPGDGKNDLQLPQAVEPGNYTVKNKDGQTLVRFSVNTPPEEADLTRVPLLDVESLFGIDSLVRVDETTRLEDVLIQQWGEPLELFPYLMVLLLVVLALENLLANKFYRREPEAVP